MKVKQQIILTAVICLITFNSSQLSAQDRDIHFTQYGMSPININPALTGIFNGDIRFTGNYRNQWFSVPVSYNTVSLAYDRKIYNVKLKNGLFGLGGMINYDQAGDSKLNSLQINLAGSYTQRITPRNFLTLGANAGFAQRALSRDNLTWDQQFQNGQFNGALPGEEIPTLAKIYPDFGVGLNWHFQVPNSRRTQFDLGAAYYHAHQPNVSFYDAENVPLRARLNAQFLGAFKVLPKFDVIANGNFYNQGESNQAVAGGGIRYHFDERIGRESAIQLGAEYRFLFRDSWAPVVTFYHKQWKVGVSYDFNLSDFSVATNGNGGPELGIMYLITKVKPLPVYKSCPIF